MICDRCALPLVEQAVTYTVELDGRWVIVEHVPARVCPQCGERLFSPDTVERLQRTAWERKNPSRVLETPVFDFTLT